ncbi:MAG: indole-3-glycerol phosphate synthase TrpC [Gemmatimonadetes bacterium]|nr:indole-3-glycerol phosphate synthase TrpC [Gemmatimonadota bacterium]
MSGVLEKIVEVKVGEVEALRRDAIGVRRRAEGTPVPAGFEDALARRPGIGVIAEVKRRSPSAGEIRGDATAASVARTYGEAGAAAVSVLTDSQFFGGSLSDLESAAGVAGVPLLRKDFTIDALQVYEARSAGASAVLLIARILDGGQLSDFVALATELELGALVEVHDESEVEQALKAGARIVGVNNRDLATFTTDLGVTERLARYVPGEMVLVGESGVQTVQDVERLARAGVDAVLVGEALMRVDDPADLIGAFSSVAREGR